jgi:hypothetical protein
MSHRIVRGLSFAEPCSRPSSIPEAKAKRGAKAAGLRFERALAKAIPQSTHGQWFKYLDANGSGHCQVDILLIGKTNIGLIECKLSNVEEGRAQIDELYRPILSWHFRRPVRGIVACQHLSPALAGDPHVYSDLKSALRAARDDLIPVFHWLGRGPI